MYGRPEQDHLRKYFYYKAAADRQPISGTFELTPRCNMDCRMCYIHMSPEQVAGRERTAQQWLEMGRQCADQGMLFLLLTGGEPFLRKDLRQIYTGLKQLGLSITINTNGTLIDDHTLEWLAADPPARVNVTLYGSSNETYRRLCGHPRGYDAAVRAIDRMTEAGILVHINSSFTRLNLPDMGPILDFGKKRGLRTSATTYMFPPVRNDRDGQCDDAVRLTPEASGQARAKAECLLLEPELLQHRLQLLHASCPEQLSSEEECTRTPQEPLGCMAGRASFWIAWDGVMTPCGLMTGPSVQPFDVGFGQAWTTLVRDTAQLFLPPECASCTLRKHCMICGAVAMAETGSTHRRPEYLCRQTKAYIDQLEAEYTKHTGRSEHS